MNVNQKRIVEIWFMLFYISRRQIAKMIEGARFFPTIIHIVASNKLGIRILPSLQPNHSFPLNFYVKLREITVIILTYINSTNCTNFPFVSSEYKAATFPTNIPIHLQSFGFFRQNSDETYNNKLFLSKKQMITHGNLQEL